MKKAKSKPVEISLLLHNALLESDVYHNREENGLTVLDILAGIAAFTSEILKITDDVLNKHGGAEISVSEYYMKRILPEAYKNTDLFSTVSDTKNENTQNQ